MFCCFLGLTLLLWSSLTGLEKAFWWTKPHPPPRSHKVVSWKAFRAEGGFLNAFPGLKLQKNWQMLAAADNFNSDGTTVYWDTRRVAETWKSTGVSRWVDIPCRVTGVPSTNCFLASFTCYICIYEKLKLRFEINDDKIMWNWEAKRMMSTPMSPYFTHVDEMLELPIKLKIFLFGLWNGYNLRNCCCFLIA